MRPTPIVPISGNRPISFAGLTVDRRTASGRLIPRNIIFEIQFGISDCGPMMLDE